MRGAAGTHDLVVVGGGSAGLVAAGFAAGLGADVLLVEASRVGGDCTWTGCVPSKALLHEAGIARRLREAGAGVDFTGVMSRVQAAVERVYAFETPEALAAQGIKVAPGQARFLDARTLDVDGRRVRGRRYVIATGARPSAPPIPGLGTVPSLTYEGIFNLDRQPRRLAILGGGPVGVELAQAFQRLGSDVTLLESGDRLLAHADPAAAALVARRLVLEGARVETAIDVEGVGSGPGGLRLRSSRGSFDADLLLVATGRTPRVEGLDLERAGVAFDARGIGVDARLRTNQAHIYAAGDVTGSFQFTHYAGWQGYVAARNALLPGAGRGVLSSVPWAVFCDPEIAQVGLTEDVARGRGLDVTVMQMPAQHIDRAQTLGDTDGFLKVVAGRSGKILGATAAGTEAAALVNELSVAMATGVTLPKLARALHVYPSFGIALQQLASRYAIRRARSGVRGALLDLAARGLRTGTRSR